MTNQFWRTLFLFLALLLASCATKPVHVAPSPPPELSGLDRQLQQVIQANRLTSINAVTDLPPAKVALGHALFFDPILSGNRDTACATCHHPLFAGGDELPLSIGTGGIGLGPERIGAFGRPLVARNAPELFNRGAPEWQTIFWDGRLTITADGQFDSPAGAMLPTDLDNILAAQAMFPVTADVEMRGFPGDLDIGGRANELAVYGGKEFPAIWAALMKRLLAIPEYQTLFQAAYPDVSLEQLTFAHAANALAAFEIDAFTLPHSPWDRYLAGDLAALPETAKRGALLFYGDAGCAQCHSGILLTDQQFHNLAVPQIGPGKGEESPFDFGRGRETATEMERFAFRTPPLRNVSVTGPYMHNGAFDTLDAVVRHHLDPATSLRAYDPQGCLPTVLWPTFQSDEEFLQALLQTVDPLLAPSRPMSEEEIADLLAFLAALTDPAVAELGKLTPQTVPSGLPVLRTASLGN